MPDNPEDDAGQVTTVASPLTVLREQRNFHLDQALFLTYTLDLHYFERVALAALRTAGARVTVIADAFASAQDARAVRWAGRTYLAGHATTAGAFHPKLMLLLGPAHAVAVIGSGNLTASGWQRNAELWTVLRADQDHAPVALADLAGWLRDLPNVVALGPGLRQALSGAVKQLEGHLTTTQPVATPTRILHNLRQPILEQLPDGPTRHLGLSAPFHDPKAATLRALLAKLDPKATTVVIQPGKTRLDAPATDGALTQHRGTALQDAQSDPYRHGKLVEWMDHSGQQWVLVGSPNLTGAALRNSTDGTGNCELAVLTRVNSALLPEGTEVDLNDCPTLPPATPQHTAGPYLLGAMLQGDHMQITFAAPLTTVADVRAWPGDQVEEQWLPATRFPPGQAECTVPCDKVAAELLKPGSRYRAATTDNGIETLSNIVFLAGPGAETPPQPARTPVDWSELTREAAILERLLGLIRDAQDNLPLPGLPPDKREGSNVHRSWAQETKRWEDAIGLNLVRAVTLPADVSTNTEQAEEEPANLDDLVPETNEDPNADRPDEEPAPQPTEEPDSGRDDDPDRINRMQRRIYQHGVRWARAATAQPLIVRLIGLRFALHGFGYAATAPATEACIDLDWHHLVVQFTIAVGEGEVPAGGEQAAGSLVATAIAVLDESCRDSDDPEIFLEDRRRLAQATNASAYLTIAADRLLIAQHAQDLDELFGFITQPDNVMHVIDCLATPDTYRDAAEKLEETGLSVVIAGKALLVSWDGLGTARRLALDAIGLVDEPQPAAAVATTPRGRCLAVHHQNKLLIADQQEHGPTLWRLYNLAGPAAPARRLLAGRAAEFGRWEIRRFGPLTVRPPDAEELLSIVDLDVSDWW